MSYLSGMARTLYTVIAFLFCSLGFAQEMLNSIPVVMKSNSRDVFQIADLANNKTVLFLSDKKKVSAFVLNESMQTIDTLSAPRPDKSFREIIGYSKNTSSLALFWGTPERTSIFAQFYDFQNHKVTSRSLSLDLDGQHFLQYFCERSVFYILTVANNNTLNLYAYDSSGNQEARKIDVPTADAAHTTALPISDILAKEYSDEKPYALQQISFDSPTSLTYSSKKRKSYSNDQTIVLTFDNNHSFTQVLTISLESYAATLSVIDKPKMTTADTDPLNSNSFLISGKLFQLVTNAEKISLTVSGPDGQTLRRYDGSTASPITFKNSDFIRLNRFSTSERKLETTAQFLKKINSDNIGISCYAVNGKIFTTIGSVSDESVLVGDGTAPVSTDGFAGAGFAGSGGFGMTISFVYFNQVNNNFASYAKRKVVYTNCLFDENGNHADGETPKLAFDKMNEFLRSYPEHSLHTIYKTHNFYCLGYYNNASRQFIIRKFEE
jgi:hypothetical protein